MPGDRIAQTGLGNPMPQLTKCFGEVAFQRMPVRSCSQSRARARPSGRRTQVEKQCGRTPHSTGGSNPSDIISIEPCLHNRGI